MSEDKTGTERVSAAPASDSQVHAEGVGESKKYSKENALLSDLAQERKKRQELEARLTDIERQKLEAEGSKDKLIQSYKEELNKHKSQMATWIKTRVEDQVAIKAKDLGCVDTELLMKAVDLDAVEIDRDTFKITNHDQVVSMLEETRKTKPFLFKQSAPEFRDGTPASRPNIKSNQVDYSKMKTSEIIELARQKAGLSKQ